MRWNTKWLWVILGFTGLIAAYLITRLTNLTGLPIFTDEAIYIRWSQIGMRDANWRFISLSDGKQPMFTWAMMLLLRVFNGMDPLFIGRLTSVFAGLGTLFGLWILSYELFRDKRVSWMTSVVYVLMPFSAWYDRVALYDSMVGTFAVWSLYFAVQLVRHLRLDTAMLLGMVLGAGMLNKSSGFLSLYFLPVTLFLFDWQAKNKWQRIVRWAGLVLVAAILSQIIYSILRLSPLFHMVGQKDNVFIFSVTEWLNQPFRFLAGNLRGMFDWLRNYMTIPLFIAAFIPVFVRWPKARETWLLYFWWILPFGALANFAKILYPRFIFFMTLPLLMIASYTMVSLWDRIKNRYLRLLLVAALLLPSVYTTWFIVTQPKAAPIPLAERGQFIDDWPAGGGVREVVAYLTAESSHQKIQVFTEGTFGLLPYAIEIYLVDLPNVKITGIWPLPPEIPQEIVRAASGSATYFVLNETQTSPNWPMTLIGEYEKGNRADHRKLRFYRVNTPVSVNP